MINNPERITMLEQVHRNEMRILDLRSTGDDSDAAQGVKAMRDAQAAAKKMKKSSKM